jgi:DnaJ like chaperone protein
VIYEMLGGLTMSILERLSAATRALSVGGQISSLLGRGSSSQASEIPGPDNEVPFTVGVIVLSAKMAKADGMVAADEVRAFKEAFEISAKEMKRAAPIFNSAKRDAANFEECAEQLAAVFKGDRKLLEDVLDGLFHIAKADEEVRPQEERFLREVAKRFGFSGEEINSIRARHMAAAHRDPYEVLGVKPSISHEQLERHYGMLVADTDTEQLVARGVPKEFMAIATEKRAALNEAYKAIVKDRAG